MDAANQSERIAFIRLWAIFGLALLAVTWRLWTPQTAFPQVPLFGALVGCPGWVDWLAVAVAVASLLVVAVSSHRWQVAERLAFGALAVALAVLFSLDQHRLQPWAWQWFVFAGLLAIAVRKQESMRWMQWIAVSIYVYSAISKFDYQFTHTVGRSMLQTLAGFVGVDVAEWSDQALELAVVSLPLIELLVGVGLMFNKTRPAAACIAILLHVMLILTLGPWGLDHRPAVLIWNAYFIIQAYFFFLRPTTQSQQYEDASHVQDGWLSSGTLAAISLFVILFPATCSFGICDHWLAWELYAPRSSRVTIELPETRVESLPPSAIPHTRPSAAYPGIVELDLSAWSLTTLDAPVYPQARFQLGVAWALAQASNVNVRTAIKSRSDRRSGKRESKTVTGQIELETASQAFWLNARPR